MQELEFLEDFPSHPFDDLSPDEMDQILNALENQWEEE